MITCNIFIITNIYHMHNKQNNNHIITHRHHDLTWFTQDGIRPQWSLLIILFRTSITKYVHCTHTLCPCRSPIPLSLLFTLHSSYLHLLAYISILFIHCLPSIPKPLHIYTITIGLILYQWTQNA
jgi:hypothetical protein